MTLAELKDKLSARPVGGGRGFMNPPTVGEMARQKALEAAMGSDTSQATKEELRNAIRERGVERESEKAYNRVMPNPEMRKGGKVKAYAKGGSVSSASKRADGIAQRGKTRGTMVACGGGYMKGKK